MANVQAFLDRASLETTASALLDHCRWTRQQLLDHQQAALRRLLERAVDTSPWYRRSLAKLVAEKRPLTDFPVLTKPELMAHFDEIVTRPEISLAAAERHIGGPQSGTRFLDTYCIFPTGGTSGVRAIVVYDETCWTNQVANAIRFLWQAGLPRDGRVVAIGSSSSLHISGRAYAELRKWCPGAPDLNVMMPLDEIVAALNDFAPEALITYPSFIRVLASEQLAGRLRISPRILGAVAESLSDDIRSLARSVWNIEISNRYNATEIGVAGSECAHGAGIHLPEDLTLFESVDDSNQPVPDGTHGRKLLVTTLFNVVQPLIRYEITDLMTVTAAPCRCGQPFARITSLSGRREELLRLPGAGGGMREIPAILLMAPLVKVPFLRQFQIALLHDAIELRLVVAEDGDPVAVRDKACAEIAAQLASLGASLPLRAAVLDEIPRGGPGAKLRLVVKE